MSHQNEPDPKFLESLEWELNSSLRRQKTLEFATGITPGQNGRLILAAMLMMAFSLAFGAAGTYAILNTPETPKLVLNLDHHRLRLELAEFRQDEVRHALQELRIREDELPPQVLFEAERHMAEANETYLLQALRYEETTRSDLMPMDNISAPLIGDRDYVTERLMIRRDGIQNSIASLSQRTEEVADLVKNGAAGDIEHLQAQEHVALARTELAGLDRQIEVRTSFLDGRLSALNAERTSLLELARTDRQRVSAQLESARAINERIRRDRPRLRRTSSAEESPYTNLNLLTLQQRAADRTIDRLEKSHED